MCGISPSSEHLDEGYAGYAQQVGGLPGGELRVNRVCDQRSSVGQVLNDLPQDVVHRFGQVNRTVRAGQLGLVRGQVRERVKQARAG
ncbi:hypothetical protein [Amycolatopsis taiwanensis]|uniref:hypothetical protein n=1 Tax=Amycolatopsis taiwanensis TaxID=342230 RepID=UPI000488BF3E|nr:hypothetical protein [Amycolatopsis taiwanensis]